MSRLLTDCNKPLQKAIQYAIKEFAIRYPTSPQPAVLESHRKRIVQEAYYAQNRMSLEDVNNLRKKAGLWLITAKENTRFATFAKPGTSKHEPYPSNAVDIMFVKQMPGQKSKLDYSPDLFLKFAQLVREYNPKITWGGDWNKNWQTKDERFIDMPHFELVA